MRQNFSVVLHADGRPYPAIFVPHMRRNGLHYEVNITGFQRFMMAKSALGRFDLVVQSKGLTDALVLAAADAIEAFEATV